MQRGNAHIFYNFFHIHSSMKIIKTIALCGVFAFAANVQAQETYAPEKGDFSVEIKFNPFSNNFETFQIDGHQGRYFMTDNDALRFGIGLGFGSKKNSQLDPEEKNNLDNYSKTQTNNFSINLGYERHFYNYKRVNLYAGAGLGFAYYGNTVTSHSEYSDGNSTVTSETKNYNVNDDEKGLKAYTEFSIAAFTGIDFYVYKGLYLGAELGLKFGVQSYPAGKTKTTNGNETNEVKGSSKTTGYNIGTFAEPALRLGWKF